MNRRDVMTALVSGTPPKAYRPAAFFLHFDPVYHTGRAAVDKHVQFFRHTGMDFVKIQYEREFPKLDAIAAPADWRDMPEYGTDFFADQLDVVSGIVNELKDEAMVVVTLYSPFMCAGQTAGNDELDAHLELDPEAVLPGLHAVRRSLAVFVEGCIEAGVDGFYASTQGGEAHRRYDPQVFDEYIKPVDLELWRLIDEKCRFNILHVCDYHQPYADFGRFVDYPGQIVSAGVELTSGTITGEEVSGLFGRPFLGGLDRHGVIAGGTEEEVRGAAQGALDSGPVRHCLGADCTLPAETSWDNIRIAVDAAHAYGRTD